MKKTIITLTVAMLLMGTTASAQTTTTTDQLIAQLQAQIVALSQKLAALKAAQDDVNSAKTNVNNTLGLITSLSEGMSGDQVSLLQATLANDPSIYPEGKITGYYGKLTRDAVKRYQKKHGLSGNGTMSSSTIAHLNDQLSRSDFKSEDEDDDDHDGDHHRGKRFCLSGSERQWEERGDHGRHRGWERVVLPRCKHIPNGNPSPTPTPTPTTTPDTVAPVVSAISVGSITSTGMTLSWTTNELSTSKVYLATSSPVGTSSAAWADSTLRTTHTATFTGLSANTTYFFVIEAVDSSANKMLATQGSFVTLVTPDTTAPTITAFSVAPTSSTTGSVTWTTNEPASSRVYFSTTSPVVIATASTMFDATLLTSHSMNLSGLTASTTYYVFAESRDAATNVSTSSASSFTTTP